MGLRSQNALLFLGRRKWGGTRTTFATGMGGGEDYTSQDAKRQSAS